MDTKKLRQKILDLAIHGKLVPQDPNDEPASVLLERIRAEKERLIAEGKIKRSKKSATSDTSHYENVPFEVPEGWCWCTVDDFAYVAAGSTPNKDAFVDEGIPYIKMYNLRNQKIDFDFHPQYIKEDVHNGKLQRSRTEVGDLIMNIVGPPLGKLAFIPESLPQSNFNQAAVLIRPYIEKNTINRWLFYYLSEMSEINSISTKGSAGQVNISLTQSQNMRVPMPPLAEQIRIVNKLDSLWNITEGIESGIKDVNCVINKFKSKILDLAIHGKLVPQDASDEPASELLKRINPKAVASCDNPHYENVPFVIPSSWAWCKVRDVADVARGGSPRPIKQYLTESPDGVNWIKIGDAEEGSKYISKTTERIIPDGVKKSRYVKVGDFLLTNSMSFGKPFILKTNGCIHDGWLVISPIDGAYEKNFLYYLLPSSFAYNQFSEKAGGAVVSNINKDKVADSLFPLPPLAEQKRIASMVEELYSSLEGIASTLQ